MPKRLHSFTAGCALILTPLVLPSHQQGNGCIGCALQFLQTRYAITHTYTHKHTQTPKHFTRAGKRAVPGQTPCSWQGPCPPEGNHRFKRLFLKRSTQPAADLHAGIFKLKYESRSDAHNILLYVFLMYEQKKPLAIRDFELDTMRKNFNHHEVGIALPGCLTKLHAAVVAILRSYMNEN
eukprot:1159067-Pelagomonas_calceolata.AAC.7